MNGQEFPDVGYEENGYRWTGQDWEPATAPMPVIDTDGSSNSGSTNSTLGHRDGTAIPGLASPDQGYPDQVNSDQGYPDQAYPGQATPHHDPTAVLPGHELPKKRGRRAASTPPPPPEVGTVYNGFRWDGHSWMPDTPLRPNLSAEARAEATAAFEAQRFAQSTTTRNDNRRAPFVILGLAVVALMGAAGLLLAKAASNKSSTDSANVQRPPTEPAQLPSPTMDGNKPQPTATSDEATPTETKAAQPTPSGGPSQQNSGNAQPPPGGQNQGGQNQGAPGGAQQPPQNQQPPGQPNQGQPNQGQQKPPGQPKPAPQPAVGRVGQPLTSGTTQLIVTSVRPGLTAPGGLQPQGRWLVADLVVTNFGKDPIALSAGSYSVVMSSGATLGAQTQAMTNSRSPLVTTLVSGKSASGTVYFDVPKDVAPTSLTVAVPGAGKLVVNV